MYSYDHKVVTMLGLSDRYGLACYTDAAFLVVTSLHRQNSKSWFKKIMASLKTLGSSDADAVFHTWKEAEVRVQRLVT